MKAESREEKWSKYYEATVFAPDDITTGLAAKMCT